MGHTIFLGAGFSKWSCELPIASELFDFAIHADNQSEATKIEKLRKIYLSWKEKHSKSNNEQFIGFAQESRPSKNLVNWYIVRRLTEPFVVVSSRRYTWYINSYHAREHKGIIRARNFLDSVTTLDRPIIVTTNYDMVIEYALGTRRFNYGRIGEQIGFTLYPYPKPLYVTGSLTILKLHGSISWDQTRKFPDLRHGLTGKCLVVPPMPEKAQPRLLKAQWHK